MPQPKSADLESEMRRISAGVSLTAILLMLIGFIGMATTQGPTSLPGASALSLGRLLHPDIRVWDLWSMSAGVVLLALLPMLRVFLSMWLFLRARAWVDMGTSLVVLLELLSSMHVGG